MIIMGAQHASGDILFFLHSDTHLPAGALEKIQKCMDNPEIVWGGFKRCLNSRGWKYRLLDLWVMCYNRLFKIITGDQGIFCRKGVFMNIGGFRGMPILEDVNLAARLKKSGQMILIKDCIRVSIRRYEKTGIFKISFLNLFLSFLYICGVSLDRIYQIYYRKFKR
ncbi:MAG TPA: glycosyltransferase [Nitrospirae bacterium]|nr:glycosyltransferase [Nitrospirota bacterium]HDH51688.1 glycosyltransferase [Nitrospirota bacterium]HDK17329.1 glycosyltransferase [Nitrospirota bacterium]